MLFDAVDTLLLVLPAVAGALAECAFRPERMRAALSSTMMATDLADYLVRKGATFREAHGAVGRARARERDDGRELHELPFASFAAAHPRFSEDVLRRARAPQRPWLQREVEGGTGPAAVRAQIDAAQAALAPPPTPRSTNAVA